MAGPDSKIFDDVTASGDAFLKGMQDGLSSLTGIFGSFGEKVRDSTNALSHLGEEGVQAIKNLSEMKEVTSYVMKMTEGLMKSQSELANLGMQAANIALVLKTGITPDAFNTIASGGEGATASLINTHNQMKK